MTSDLGTSVSRTECDILKRNSSSSVAFLVPGHKHLGIMVLSHHQFLAEELPMSRDHLGYIRELCFWQGRGNPRQAHDGSLCDPQMCRYYTCISEDAFLRMCVMRSPGSSQLSPLPSFRAPTASLLVR